MITDEWNGPHGGVPPLHGVQVEDFEPAIDEAIRQHRVELDGIATCPDAPTFENLIVAMERAGQTLDRVTAIYHLWSSNHSSPAFRASKRRIEPKLTAHRDRTRQDERLIARLKVVLSNTSSLNAEQTRLLEVVRRGFVRAGSNLDEPGRVRLRAINAELATCFAAFDENLLADEETVILFLKADQLDGLSLGWRAGAQTAAIERGRPDRWAVLNSRSSAQPFLESSQDRTLRETVWRAFTSRGDGQHDNAPLITKILLLRTERAQLLGYPTSAHMLLDHSMAATPERAQELLERIWPAAKNKFERECDEMRAWARSQGQPTDLQPWDVRFYAQRVQAEQHSIDGDLLQQHLSVERLRDGLFWMAERFLGWTFSPAKNVPLSHPDMTAWIVHDTTGVRGLWVFDPFSRVGKRSGAWMTAWRVQQNLDGPVLPIVSNNENYIKAPDGQPTLLSWDDAQTLFHEFGHAMHGLASNVTYPTLAGTNVARDFVEFPSQLAEHWLNTPELLQQFALNDAGSPLPDTWLHKLKQAENASSGFQTVEFMASAWLDLLIHQQTEAVDPRTFETEMLHTIGMPAAIAMRHRLPHFSHIFSSDGYASAYYSYLWADVLVADAAERFAEEGFYDKALARRYHDEVLSRGNTVDPGDAYRAFLGRDPRTEALLRDRGLC